MAYRRPGVTVTQEFLGLVPALAAFTLPSVTVGAAYQLVNNDFLGTYGAVEALFPYASLLGGAIVDLSGPVDGGPATESDYPITLKEISATLRDAKVEVLGLQSTGAVAGSIFTDATDLQFADVVAGDVLKVQVAENVEIISERNDGASVSTPGQRNRLYAGVGNDTLFAQVKTGDSVTVVTGGYFGTQTFLVTAKVNSNILILDGDVNDGTGDVSNVTYSIAGDRGTTNEGEYTIRTKTSDNELVLVTPLADTPESPLSYSIVRKVGDVVLDRVSTTAGNGYVAEEEGVTLPLELTYEGFNIISGRLYVSYRALRTDLASEVRQFVNVASLNSVFGVGQILPANPLAYGVSIMLQNTVTPVHGLALDGNGVVNEVLAFTAALDVLELIDMYAIAVLTHSPVVHTMFKNHVEQMSMPNKKLERVVIFNSKLVDVMVLKEESTTVSTINGSRQIVGLQLDGEANAVIASSTLIDGTAGQFANVKKGDNVVVVSGTNVTPGTYTVLAVVDENTLTLDRGFITSSISSDINYYIYRLDGLAAGGASFYDRNASFLADGIASGHYLNILSGNYAGRYKIAVVLSDREVTLHPAVIAAQTLVTGVEYQVDRDLQKYEQADAVKGYSEAFASRRCVHVWPDDLQVPIGQQLYYVPGFFACSAIAGLVTGLPTQQGFTNLAISGFLGFRHSTRYFSEEDLDAIADGGTMILAQDGASQPLYVRHQLTTDRSAIKFQEFSVTKNVDFIAKFLRNSYSRYIGQYNIVDTTMDSLRTTGGAAIKFLKEKTKVPRFGGVIRTGSLKYVKENAEQIDTVDIRFSFGIPIPLNNIDIVIEV